MMEKDETDARERLSEMVSMKVLKCRNRMHRFGTNEEGTQRATG